MTFGVFNGVLLTGAVLSVLALMVLILIKDGPHELLQLITTQLRAMGF